jgi:hypothetical protein
MNSLPLLLQIEQMHDRKGDRMVVWIDRYPGILLREIDLGADRVIIGQIGIGRGTKVGGSGMLNDWQLGRSSGRADRMSKASVIGAAPLVLTNWLQRSS